MTTYRVIFMNLYSKAKMYLLHTVVSSYEVNDIVHLMREVDPKVIINMVKTK